MQDHYETLQVHPRADAAAIAAAYQRLRAVYDPAKLDGAADELVDLARAKRDAIERAYVVLGDPQRRAAYDAEQASHQTDDRPPTVDHIDEQAPDRQSSVVGGQEAALDYRPLPPARRQERARGVAERSLPATGPAGRVAARRDATRFAAPVAIASLLVLIVATSLLLTNGGGPPPPPPTPTLSPLDQYETAIPQAQAAADQNPKSAQAWIDLGNVLYDSVQLVRESAPDSPLYQQRLGRWLQATNAYSQALALEPDNAATRADMGASSCFYGAGTGDPSFVDRGTAEVERAAQSAPDDERVLLSMGHCLVSEQPPKTEQALASWRKIVERDPASPFAAQVKQLIDKYSK